MLVVLSLSLLCACMISRLSELVFLCILFLLNTLSHFSSVFLVGVIFPFVSSLYSTPEYCAGIGISSVVDAFAVLHHFSSSFLNSNSLIIMTDLDTNLVYCSASVLFICFLCLGRS